MIYSRINDKYSWIYRKYLITLQYLEYINVYEFNLEYYQYYKFQAYLNFLEPTSYLSAYIIPPNILIRKTDKKYFIVAYFKIPEIIHKKYFQSYVSFDSISIISGWIFIFSTLVGYFVSKCAKIKLYESLCNSVFNWIHPDKKEALNMKDNEIKEKMNSEKTILVDLLVDDAYKYYDNKGLNLSIKELMIYIFCCDKFKTHHQIKLEKSFNIALNELFKYIDIVNIVKSSQDVKLLKEIVLESHQKRIFENILSPVIELDKITCTYKADFTKDIKDYSVDEEKVLEEKTIKEKEEMKNVFYSMTKNEIYNEIDQKLISLLKINPKLKEMYFKINQKIRSVKDSFINLESTPSNKESVLMNYEKLVRILDHEMEELRYLVNSLTNETKESKNNYEQIFIENTSLKDIIFKNEKQIGNKFILNLKNSQIVSQ